MPKIEKEVTTAVEETIKTTSDVTEFVSSNLDTFAVKLMDSLEKAGAIAVDNAPAAMNLILKSVQVPAIMELVVSFLLGTTMAIVSTVAFKRAAKVRQIGLKEYEESRHHWLDTYNAVPFVLSLVISLISGIICAVAFINNFFDTDTWIAAIAPEVSLTKTAVEAAISSISN